MVPSKNAVDLIKKFEGCQLDAYLDPVGIPTIGWGTTGPGIQLGLTITQNTADAMLTGHVREVGLTVTDYVGNQLNQNQFDAICCLTYNIGTGNLKSSTLLKLIKAQDYANAALEFLKWNHSHGKVLPGLTIRRQAEHDLFTRNV